MVENDRINKILFGGDYNPEQWPEEIWQEDMRLFHLAHVDIVTLNVFSWSALQPAEDSWNFNQLDKIMQLAKDNHLYVCLATSTGAHPAWMAKKYPEILRVNENGIRRKFGSRHNSCPNSPIYRRFSSELAERLAKRYKDYDNLIAWHVSNEYGGMCYCENCEKAFRIWLKKKYGTLDKINRAWNTSFWGHTFYDWEEIVVPDQRSEEFYTEYGRLKTNFQGISLDYRRFMSDSMLDCYRLEYKAIKKETPDIPVTTNMMGTYSGLDYQSWSADIDFVSWDNYPAFDAQPWEPAFQHDLMRGLKQGKPFALMEQTPSVSNWHPYCVLKRPGMMRLISWQAVAHGADTIMFFQMRQSIGACEKFHGALISHRGNENTRVFKEMSVLGEELEKIGSKTLRGRTPAHAAIIFDWDNWWATQLSAGPTVLLDYLKEIKAWYRSFWEKNIPVDIISVNDPLEQYQVVAVPMLYMCKYGFGEKLTRWVSEGGCVLGSYFTGYVDENDLIYTGGYPGSLKDMFGIWVEEADALTPDASVFFSFHNQTYSAEILCDLVHPEGAVSLGEFQNEFYSGMPAITRNAYGKGNAYYIATHSSPDFYRELLNTICQQQNLTPIADSPAEVEVTMRCKDNFSNYFILNHGASSSTCRLPVTTKDFFTGQTFYAGEEIPIYPNGVKILYHDSDLL